MSRSHLSPARGLERVRAGEGASIRIERAANAALNPKPPTLIRSLRDDLLPPMREKDYSKCPLFADNRHLVRPQSVLGGPQGTHEDRSSIDVEDGGETYEQLGLLPHSRPRLWRSARIVRHVLEDLPAKHCRHHNK